MMRALLVSSTSQKYDDDVNSTSQQLMMPYLWDKILGHFHHHPRKGAISKGNSPPLYFQLF